MKTALLLGALLSTLALATPATANPGAPSYSHSMQSVGTSELGLPPFRETQGVGPTCGGFDIGSSDAYCVWHRNRR